MRGWAISATFCIGVLAGCDRGPSATVTGRVTCGGEPIDGMIQFTAKAESADNTGPPAFGQIAADGSFEVALKSIGKHTVVVTPSDIRFPVPKGEFDHRCDHSPRDVEIVSGSNTINLELTLHK